MIEHDSWVEADASRKAQYDFSLDFLDRFDRFFFFVSYIIRLEL